MSEDPASLEPLSWDFGQLRRGRPLAAVRADSARDVAAVLRYASSHAVPVTARGSGYSMNGQSLSDGGIVLDLRAIQGVRGVGEGHVVAGAGATWKQVVVAALRAGRVPPVLTSNPWATVGGTISVGGIGTSSFRYGSQACNCLEITAVTGDGRIAECSREIEPALFDAVRCGLGQFGIATEVTIRLVAHRPSATTWTLIYRDLDALLEDMREVVETDRALAIAAGARRDGERWVFPLRLSFDGGSDSPEVPPDVRELSAPVHPSAARGDPALALAGGVERAPEFGAGHALGKAHPWIDTFMPWRSTAEYVRTLLERPVRAHARTIALWPLRRSRLGAPLLVAPPDELLMGVSVLPVVPRERLGEAMAVVADWSATSIGMGGKRYLSGWTGFDAAGWRDHYGSIWPELERVKARYDPAGILNPRAVRWR